MGRLSLDDALASYLPGIRDAETIGLLQLLSHTAGISDVAKDPQTPWLPGQTHDWPHLRGATPGAGESLLLPLCY